MHRRPPVTRKNPKSGEGLLYNGKGFRPNGRLPTIFPLYLRLK